MADTLYSFDREERYLLIRGEDNTLTATWSRDGATVTPTPGTVTVRRPGGTDVVSGSAFSVSSNEAQITIGAASLPTSLSLEEGWQVIWEGVGLPDGSSRTFVSEAALVRYVLAPPSRVQDLYKRFARLSPDHPSPMLRPTSEGGLDLQDKLDEAWREIERRLYAKGRRPELVMSPTQFRVPHRELALALTFEDLRTSNWEAWNDTAVQLRDHFESMWDELTFTYDADQDGLPDGGSEPLRQSAESGSTWLTARGRDATDEPLRDA